MFEGIINPQTLAAFRAGGSAVSSVLGRAGSRALSRLGLQASSFDFQTVGDGVNLVIGVK